MPSILSQAFVETWEEIDEDGSGLIHATHLTSLLIAVPPPMGVKGMDRLPKRVQEIVQDTKIPLRWDTGTKAMAVLHLNLDVDLDRDPDKYKGIYYMRILSTRMSGATSKCTSSRRCTRSPGGSSARPFRLMRSSPSTIG